MRKGGLRTAEKDAAQFTYESRRRYEGRGKGGAFGGGNRSGKESRNPYAGGVCRSIKRGIFQVIASNGVLRLQEKGTRNYGKI